MKIIRRGDTAVDHFIKITRYEGAILMVKAERGSLPHESIKKILFSMLLSHKS